MCKCCGNGALLDLAPDFGGHMMSMECEPIMEASGRALSEVQGQTL